MISNILIAVLITFVIWWFVFRGSLHLYDETIRAYCGTVGSGKTYMAVRDARDAYFRQAARYKHHNNRLWCFFFPACRYPPELYSTIPIRLYKAKGKRSKYGKRKRSTEWVWSKPLRKEHLLMQARLPEKVVIMIDELGAFASQWDFDNPNVREQLQTLMRYFRHFVDGRIYITDQSVDRIVKPIRELIGRVFWLCDFRRMWGILPIYQVSVTPLLLVADTSSRVNEDEDEYLRGWLPYSWMRWLRKYDTRCYSVLYDQAAVRDLQQFDELKCRYTIDLQVPKAVQDAYKTHRDVYRAWWYDTRPWDNATAGTTVA